MDVVFNGINAMYFNGMLDKCVICINFEALIYKIVFHIFCVGVFLTAL